MEQTLQQAQQDQLGNQQIAQQMAQQQMMLCPVRLVYETPILMQQGDQMQGNQTIFINPQNPPPWARPVQNQVIYVQQLPSNNMIPIQQHVDPNQLYLQQNYVNYPQMVPQLIQNQQAIVPNMLPPNMMQSIQGNIHNVQGSIQNMQNVHASVQNMQNIQSGIQNIQNIQNMQNVQTNLQNIQAHIHNVQANVQNVQSNVQTNAHQANVQNVQTNVQSVQANAQNVQASIQGNVQNIQTSSHNITDGRITGQALPNYDQPHNSRSNNVQNTVQNQIVMVQNMNNRQVMTNMQAHQQMMNQNMLASQKPTELPKQIVYRNIVPQGNQPLRQQAPQMSNQMQNMTNVQGLQQMGQILSLKQPTQMPQNFASNAPQSIQQTFVTMPTTPAPVIRNMVPNMQNTQTSITRNIVPNNIPNQTVRNITPNSGVNSGTTVSYNAIRNGQSYTYRAIQPRPPQQYKNVPNLLPMPNQPVQPRPNVPTINIPSCIQNSHQIRPTNTTVTTSINNVTLNYVRPEDNTSRKRKSESPDEVQKKVATSSTVYGNMTVTAKASPIPGNITSVGVNTSPVRKIEDRNLIINQSSSQLNKPMDPLTNIIKTEPNTQAHVFSNNVFSSPKQAVKVETKDVTMQTEKEKLVRNTVFTQARGRLLNDKQSIPLNTSSVDNTSTMPAQISNQAKTNEIIQLLSKTITKLESPEESNNKNYIKTETMIRPVETSMKIDTKTELLTAMPAIKLETECKENIVKINESAMRQVKTEIKDNGTPLSTPKMDEVLTKKSASESNVPTMKTVDTLTTHVKSESSNVNVKPKDEKKLNDKLSKPDDKIEKITVTKQEPVKEVDYNIRKSKMDYTNVSLNDLTDKEIRIVDGSIVKDDKEFLLTHVLDGYVIQESNVPFAIRRPLKEKSLFTNPQAKPEQSIQEKQEDLKDVATKDETKKENDSKKIPDLTNLHLNEEKIKAMQKEDNKIPVEDKSNPFGNLKQAVVKSWTVEQLSAHLAKYEWNETISLFREHEIDGESLFLVSKPQLVTIGVNENHAEVICEFVKS